MPAADSRREFRECQDNNPLKGVTVVRPVTPFLSLRAAEEVREILLSRNLERTQAYNSSYLPHLNCSYRGILFAMRDERGERGFRTVEKQTTREFVVLN